MPIEIGFRGEELDGGRIRFTSPDLKGFRLIVHPGQSPEDQLTDALTIFYPIYVANRAKHSSPTVASRVVPLEYTAVYA